MPCPDSKETNRSREERKSPDRKKGEKKRNETVMTKGHSSNFIVQIEK